MTNSEQIDAAFIASGLAAFGYSPHIRSANGCMVTYSSMKYDASVKFVLNERGEVQFTVYTMLDRSMMKVEIGMCSAPHPSIMQFINQIERLVFAWRNQEGI